MRRGQCPVRILPEAAQLCHVPAGPLPCLRLSTDGFLEGMHEKAAGQSAACMLLVCRISDFLHRRSNSGRVREQHPMNLDTKGDAFLRLLFFVAHRQRVVSRFTKPCA